MMATTMFRCRRCFNRSTSEMPDDSLVVVLGVAISSKREGDDEVANEGLEIDTTSPNCAEDAEGLFRCIGITSPNCAPGDCVAEPVKFAMASFAIAVLSEFSGSLEYNRRDRGRLERDVPQEPLLHPIPFDIIRDALFETIVEDTDSSDGEGDATYASTALPHIIVNSMNNISCPADVDVDRGDTPREVSMAHRCSSICLNFCSDELAMIYR